MSLTLDQVKKMIPTNKEPEIWHSFAVEFFPKYDITTKNRIAGFFAQTAHESGDYNSLIENLNYSWQGLRKTFSKYFPTDAIAKQYERNPQKIANVVYNDANRSANSKLGNIYEGDGYRFRGRGLIQLTGRFNYEKFGKYIGKTAEEAAVYCGTKRGAFESACWFWTSRNLNKFADSNDIVGMSRAINGGDIGLTDRRNRYNNNLVVLKNFVTLDAETTQPVTNYRMLAKGSRGEDVKIVQKFFKISADGIFGNITEKYVRSWQRTKSYLVTGKLSVDQVREIHVAMGIT